MASQGYDVPTSNRRRSSVISSRSRTTTKRRKSVMETLMTEPGVYDREKAPHWKLDAEEVAYIRKLFHTLDMDGNNMLDAREIEEFISGYLNISEVV